MQHKSLCCETVRNALCERGDFRRVSPSYHKLTDLCSPSLQSVPYIRLTHNFSHCKTLQDRSTERRDRVASNRVSYDRGPWFISTPEDRFF